MILMETNRLLIGKIDLKDAQFILRLMNSQGWLEFIGDRNIKTISDSKKYIKSNFIKSYAKNGFGLYKMQLRSTHKTIGICGFVKREYLDHPDIGFAILPEYEGQGYTSEGAQKVLDFGFGELDFKMVLGITMRANIASKIVLEKIGLREKGLIKPPKSKEELLLFSRRL